MSLQGMSVDVYENIHYTELTLNYVPTRDVRWCLRKYFHVGMMFLNKTGCASESKIAAKQMKINA